MTPSEILDLTIEPAEREWKPEWQAVLDQFNLFHGQPKTLAKLPYKFSYVFRCADTCGQFERAGPEPKTDLLT